MGVMGVTTWDLGLGEKRWITDSKGSRARDPDIHDMHEDVLTKNVVLTSGPMGIAESHIAIIAPCDVAELLCIDLACLGCAHRNSVVNLNSNLCKIHVCV